MELEMLRMEFYEFPNCMKLRMEGRFERDFAEHAKTLIGSSQPPSKLIVDLSEVNFVDAVGEEVLLSFKEMGVTFAADSVYSRDVCERLLLPIEGEQTHPSHSSHGKRNRAQNCPTSSKHTSISSQGETHP